MDRALIDHRGPEFADMTRALFADLEWLFGASAGVMIFPSSASGCWEAALVNTLSPGDGVLACDNGFFAAKWGSIAERLGFDVDVIEGDWRRPVDPAAIGERLDADTDGRIRAVLVVHNETSTGVTSDIAAVRTAMDVTGHDALLMVDAVSSLGTTPLLHDDWGIDVTVCGSQKGLMLPPGLSLCAVSEKALGAHAAATSPRAYWDFSDMRTFNERGFFPSTPPTSLLYGLAESIAMFRAEGLEAVFARHARFAQATRGALAAWGLENYCLDPAAYSNSVTTVLMPQHVDANEVIMLILNQYGMSLGGGLGPLAGKVFRIGHLGDLDPLMLMGALAGVEMGLRAAGVAVAEGGLDAAMAVLRAAPGGGPP